MRGQQGKPFTASTPNAAETACMSKEHVSDFRGQSLVPCKIYFLMDRPGARGASSPVLFVPPFSYQDPFGYHP